MVLPKRGVKTMNELEKETAGMGAKNVPEVGKVYHVFDDGKITLMRHFLVKCKEVIPFKKLSTDPNYKKLYESWQEAVSEIDWVFSPETDYVAWCELFDEDTNEVVPNEEPLYYARTKYLDWFGFGTMLDDGVLDVDRKVWEQFYIDSHNPELFGYSEDDLHEIEILNNF
jgi:hypothetical protein